jgi:hypothetical protein
MEPLFEVSDPDALNTLFDSTDVRSSPVTVTFGYCGQQFTITADDIQLAPPDPAGK